MKIYLFRFLDHEGIPTDQHGIVSASNNTELFWAIDEHGDPGCCQVKRIDSVSMVFNTEVDEDIDNFISVAEGGLAFGESMFDHLNSDESAWRPCPHYEKKTTPRSKSHGL